MSFTVPERRQLVERALSDIDARLAGASSRLRASNLNVLGIVHAGAVDGLYRYLSWIKDQMFIKTCDEEQLVIRADELRVPRKAASLAGGDVVFQATVGSLIPALADLVRPDGIRYQTVAEAAESGGLITVSVRAVVAGVAGNMAANSQVTLLTPVAGVQSSGLVASSGIGGGADVEGVEPWRDRVIRRMSQAPQGGAETDYETWALEVAGVTRVWPAPHEMGVGTITIRFVRDDDDSIIPDFEAVTLVQSYLDERRPVTVKGLYVVAPIAAPLNFDISMTPGTSAVRENVESALRDLIRREAVPGGTLLLSHIRETISTAVGEDDHVLNAPVANVVHGLGELAVMGSITWS